MHSGWRHKMFTEILQHWRYPEVSSLPYLWNRLLMDKTTNIFLQREDERRKTSVRIILICWCLFVLLKVCPSNTALEHCILISVSCVFLYLSKIKRTYELSLPAQKDKPVLLSWLYWLLWLWDWALGLLFWELSGQGWKELGGIAQVPLIEGF